MMKKIFAIILFVCCCSTGMWLSVKKPLWNDEVYSQIRNVQGLSYGQILTVHIAEGNVCPMFYAIQKVVCDVFGFRLNGEWHGEEIKDQHAQFILRIAPNICMSLGLAVLFWFYARQYSFALGMFAFLSGLSSFMVWAYWAEARPYALWFLLTVVQALIFIRILKEADNKKHIWQWLLLVNVLLALTVTFSMVQTATIALLLLIDKEKCVSRRLIVAVLPLVLSAVYFVCTPKYSFYFNGSPLFTLGLSLHLEWLWVVILYAVFLGWRTKALYKAYGFYLLIMGFFAWGMAVYFKSKGNHGGFEFTYRYILFLAPIGIIAVSSFAAEMFQWCKKDSWTRNMLWVVLISFLLIRCLKTYVLVLGQYQW